MADFLPYASEEEKRKAEARAVLERQNLASTQATLASKLEEQRSADEERKKNEKIADAMGLSVQEKAAYLKSNAPSLVEEGDTIPTGAETAKEVKLAPPTAPSPQGGVGTKPTDTQPVTSGGESQATTTQAIAGVAKLADKVQASKSGATSKPTLDTLTGYLDNVAKDVNNDPRFNNTGVERDLLAARADAYKMYKEKADRNQLLGTVERAINAIAQFASAQAGFGTRQAGGNLPLSSADYGGQTEQAFKEYQTEVGLLGEEQKVGERAKERGETAKEKEIGRRQKTILEKIETERNALKEAAAEKRAQITEGGREASLKAAEARANKRENDAIAKGDVKEITKNISVIDGQLAALNSIISPVKKTDAVQGLNKYASSMGLDVAGVQNKIDAASGFSRAEGNITPDYTSKKEATRSFAEEEIRKAQERKQALLERLSQFSKGKPAPTTEAVPAAAPTGQVPASDGMVTVILDGKRGQIPSSQLPAFTKKHPNAIVE